MKKMEIEFSEKRIVFEKELNSLDNLVVDFCAVLNRLNIKYVVVSGYVSILFGRNRASEDVDLVIENIDIGKFLSICKELGSGFEILNAIEEERAYEDYLKEGLAIRFSRKDKYVPNMEVKFPKTNLERVALDERIEVVMSKNKLYISPIELQIAFKIFLSSEKDIEDAKYLYELFKTDINQEKLMMLNRKLNIEDKFNEWLK